MGKITLNAQQVSYAVDPVTFAYLSTNGSPTQTYSLTQNVPTGIIGFKVPQGVSWKVPLHLLVRMNLVNSSGVSLQPSDIVSLYVSLPSNTTHTFGTLLAQKPYSYYIWVPYSNQFVEGYQKSLYFDLPGYNSTTWNDNNPITTEIPENSVLIFAVTSFTTGESVDWAIGYSEINFEVFEVTKR